jgi:hypothetical protein
MGTMMRIPPAHLAKCDYCGRKIAFSRRRRQWLSLAPVTEMPGSKLGRRMTCPASKSYHDPKASVYDRALALFYGATS